MKTLKAEEVNEQTYDDLSNARSRIGAFIETVYNADRLHSALGLCLTHCLRGDLPQN